jgi:outer membrane murein-binding lipoprotein Lpp
MLAISAILTFLGSPLGRFAAVVGGGSLAILIAGGVGFYKGDHYRAGVDDAAGARARIEFLQKQVDARDAAAKEDAARAAADAVTTTTTETKTDDAIKGTSTAVCLDGNDANQLRALWGKPVPVNRKPRAPVPAFRPSGVLF